jgi:hypothetical protein
MHNDYLDPEDHINTKTTPIKTHMKTINTYRNLVIVSIKNNLLVANPVQPDGKPVHSEILSLLGFEPDGSTDGDLAALSLDAYKAKVVEFFAKDALKTHRLLFLELSDAEGGQLFVELEMDVSENLPVDAMFQFSETFSRGDLTKWGASDFYPDKEAELCAALASGKPFDTGWGGCKKEICSSRVSFDGKTITCEVSVSDDFDTEGLGSVSIPAPATFDQVETALDQAACSADENRDDNADYTGFSIHRGDDKGPWVETYIAQRSDMAGYMDCPPGDNYDQWGFQDETDEISAEDRETMENYIVAHQFDVDFAPFVCGNWTVTRWAK